MADLDLPLCGDIEQHQGHYHPGALTGEWCNGTPVAATRMDRRNLSYDDSSEFRLSDEQVAKLWDAMGFPEPDKIMCWNVMTTVATAVRLGYVVPAALAQQAQPLTDDALYGEAIRICDTVMGIGLPKNFTGTIRSALYEIALWARDRMAQQAQPDCLCCGTALPHKRDATCPRQAQPLTDDINTVEFRNRADVSYALQRFAESGGKFDSNGQALIDTILRAAFSQKQAQPEMPTPEAVAESLWHSSMHFTVGVWTLDEIKATFAWTQYLQQARAVRALFAPKETTP